MADTPETDKLVKKEPEAPAPDPVTSRSTSSILLVCALLLTGVLAWSLYDEVILQRPWKGVQQDFVKRYNRHLKRLKRRGNPTEQEVKASEEYQRLAAEADQARQAVQGDLDAIDSRVRVIDSRLAAVTDPFQEKRGRITVINYRIETADADDKDDLRKEADELRREPVEVELPADDGSKKVEERKLDYAGLETTYNGLKDEKARLLAERGEKLKRPNELAKERDEYLKNNMVGLTDQQLSALIRKNDNFDFSFRQVNVPEHDIVDRCETCHLGVREPLTLTPTDMRGTKRRPDSLARAFVSHPSKELLQIHSPDRFGCASCHGGNGRATTSVEKGHGRHRFWLHPLRERANMEAGCQQCHQGDRVLQGAPSLTLGKDLYYERGCVGCHRYEGFDRESDALSSTRQTVKQLQDQITLNERESKQSTADSAVAQSDEDVQRLLARAENLRVSNSQIEARIAQLNTQSRYLMQDQKKVGPNLKDVRLKLRKEWIPAWLQDPQAFRPGTKMPTFWYLSGEKGHGVVPPEQQEEERKAISAYLWQSAFEGELPKQPQGDAARGKEMFETRGCLACHSVGEGDQRVGSDFAANLQRLGQKANYDYIVRWVHNPRERWAPYCPQEKRDLTPDDYARKGRPFVFDTGHTQCPNDGAELQVQNMTVMPNFRLADQDARDIATYLVSLSGQANFPEAPFMDDPKLKEQGRGLIKQYGCAGCHEIRGFEDEQRIGKELTTEGSTPIERLDFALLTHKAELGIDPYDEKKKTEEWYNHKGFVEHKLKDPAIYDLGKEKDARDHLRMPKPYIKDEEELNALTTFILGSVGTEGANVPKDLFYNPSNAQKDIQDGWWVIKKYNCMGCHSVQVGQASDLSRQPQYLEGGALGREQLPPGLTTEGARVDPDWLLRFLRDPSLSGRAEAEEVTSSHGGARGAPLPAMTRPAPAVEPGGGHSQGGDSRGGAASASSQTSAPAATPGAPAPGAQNGGQAARAGSQQGAGAAHGQLLPQPGENRNGVRTYLRARMPTFNFSPNELRTLVRFFLAVSSQQEPYIKERLEPLSAEEMNMARALFTSQAAPCLKCHMTGNPGHDATATAPNFLLAGTRLKPDWTFRWLLDPQRIMPGTAMPSGLFRKEGERWVFNNPLPKGSEQSFAAYEGDHAKLLVRYMLQLTQDEQARLDRMIPAAPAPSSAPPAPVASAHDGLRTPPPSAPPRRAQQRASRGAERARRARVQVSARRAPAGRAAPGGRARREVSALGRPRFLRRGI